MFEDTTNDFFISETIQMISTQRGKRKLLFDGYIYRLDRLNDRGIEQWRCSKKNCRGRIHLHHSSNITLISPHSHAPEPSQCEAAIVVDHIRTSAQYNLHESPKEIVHRLLRSVTDETAANLPSITAMQRSIQRRRQQQKILDSFSINIEPSFTNNIEIFYRSIDDNSPLHLTELGHNQILVLTSDDDKQKLSNTSIWLCTTLNEEVSEGIFTIQIFDHERLIPIMYAFLPSNSENFYMKLFKQLFPLQSPKYIITNFDRILIDSLNNFFRNHSISPQIKICSIFLQNELSKSVQQYQRSIQGNEYKYLLALAYIPQCDVITAFETLQEICSSTIEGVYDKFEDLCIGRLRPNGQRARALFPMKIWNWTDVMSDFENLLLINTSIQQWDEIFRTSLSACIHQNFSQIVSTIQQLHYHQMNTKNEKIEPKIITKNFQFQH